MGWNYEYILIKLIKFNIFINLLGLESPILTSFFPVLNQFMYIFFTRKLKGIQSVTEQITALGRELAFTDLHKVEF